MIELGYALKSLGVRKLILIQNVAFGGPELLPFDLRQKRVLKYESAPDAESRVDARRQLQAELHGALTLMLSEPEASSEYPVELAISYDEKRIVSERHDYQLRVTLKNVGNRTITDWHVDLEIPTRLLDPNVTHTRRVSERSDEEWTLLRATHDAVYPGDTKLAMTVDYRIDQEIFMNQRGLFNQSVTAVAYVNGEVGAKAEQNVRDLQIF